MSLHPEDGGDILLDFGDLRSLVQVERALRQLLHSYRTLDATNRRYRQLALPL